MVIQDVNICKLCHHFCCCLFPGLILCPRQAPPPAPTSPVAARSAPPSQPVPPPAPAPVAEVPVTEVRAEVPRPTDTAKLEKEAVEIIKSCFDKVRTPKELVNLLQEYAAKDDKHHYKQLYKKTIQEIASEMGLWYTLPPQVCLLATQMISCLLDSGLLGSYEHGVLNTVASGLKNPNEWKHLNFCLHIVNGLLDRLYRWPILCSEISRMNDLAKRLPPLTAYVLYAKQIMEVFPEDTRNSTRLPNTHLQHLQHVFPQPPQRETILVPDAKGEWGPGSMQQDVEQRRAEARF
eukprot:symbB.v1.2.038644.t1/scaffold6074.1/size21155/3